MNQPEHTSEPWEVSTLDGSTIQYVAEHPDREMRQHGVPGTQAIAVVKERIGQTAANAERIVACVNACAGIPTAALESGMVKDLLEKCDKIIQWLEGLAQKAEEQGKDTRFLSLAEAYQADARNYRATAASIKKDIARAKGEEV